MATAKVFIDFDTSLSTPNSRPVGISAASWADLPAQDGVFIGPGVLTSNYSATGALAGNYPALNQSQFIAGRTANSGGFGNGTLAGASAIATVYPSYGLQWAVRRSSYSIGSEVWCSMDINWSNILSLGPPFHSNSTDLKIFRWGDVSIGMKSALIAVTTYTVILTVQINGVEVDTVVVPNVTVGMWSFLKVHVKLDATTGIIQVQCDGFDMFAGGAGGLTGQNTVPTIALASTGTILTADHIYLAPPIFYDTNFLTWASCDNIYVSADGWMSGRPTGNRVSLGSSSVDSAWAAVGTGATTIPDALSSGFSDAKAARGTGNGAHTEIDLAAISTTGLETDQVGFNVYLVKTARRDYYIDRRINVGLQISGTPYMGVFTQTHLLFTSTTQTPPNTDYQIKGLFEGLYGGLIQVTLSNLSAVKVRLLTS